MNHRFQASQQMTVAPVLIHHLEFDWMIRLESFLFPVSRFGLRDGIMNEQYATSIGRPGRIMAVTVIRKRLHISSIGTHRINICNRPWSTSIRSVRVNYCSNRLLLGRRSRLEQSGRPQECKDWRQ
jgi:hypothetical protein